ncbi:MAG: DUF1566 domain-containing protein, partial [Gammaproteobacteria bacterium]|nr:DUF1566 domain-containing protein [Gammaproteobacteria bacterium]
THRNFIIISLLATPVQVFAGNMTPPAGPASPASAMYTLQDICNRLDLGTAGVKRAGAFTEPGAAPAATGCSYDDVMTKAPATNNPAGAAPADVIAGKTFWGLLSGNWGLQTGTAAAGANVNGGNGLKTFTIPDALYSAGKTATANDANLVSANIKSGKTIFGVAGDTNVADTSSGDAVAGNLLINKKAWVDGAEITGTAYSAPVEKTGQTACYHPTTNALLGSCAGTGQDGEYQKGVAWPGSRFTNSNGTITDTLSGLVWLANANCTDTLGGVDPTANLNQWKWADALTWTAALGNGSCSLADASSAGDWRLPNINELQSLLDYSNIPALPAGHSFSGVQGKYWTSTTCFGNAGNAWYVYLINAATNYTSKTSNLYVLPVRGGQ